LGKLSKQRGKKVESPTALYSKEMDRKGKGSWGGQEGGKGDLFEFERGGTAKSLVGVGGEKRGGGGRSTRKQGLAVGEDSCRGVVGGVQFN